MRRETEYFSIYSLISMRTMFFSSSNRHSASALASSVLPTPVGPRNRKEPMGRLGSCDAGPGADDGLRHPGDGFVLADDPLVQDVVQVQQLLPLALPSALPRECRSSAPTIRAISSSVTLSRSRVVLLCRSRPASPPPPAVFAARAACRICSSAALFRS